MKNEKIISILIPTYNRVTYLKECLDSVLIQEGFSEKELEIIISDNSDNNITENFINEYKLNNKNKIIIYNKNTPNIGPINNFNKLLELKNGNYFIFLSDDDIFFDNKSLISLYEGIKINNYDLAYGNNVLMKNNEIKVVKSYLTDKKNIFKDHNIGFGGTLYKDYGYIYDLNAGLYCDYDFNVNYVLNKSITFVNINSIIYRFHEGQSINTLNGIDDNKLKLFIYNKYNCLKYNKKQYINTIIYYNVINLLNKIGVYKIISKIIISFKKLI